MSEHEVQKNNQHPSINPNPLIEDATEDTLLNVHTVMLLMQDYCVQQSIHGMDNSQLNAKSVAMGMNLVLQCCTSAIEHELAKVEDRLESTG